MKTDKLKETVNPIKENASVEAIGIAQYTGTRKDAVQSFIDTHKLNAKKLLSYVAKGKLKERMDFVSAISGKEGNPIQKKIIKMFSVNENKSNNMKNIREAIRNIIREESDYQEFFKRALEKTGKSIPDMSDEEKKAFFNKIDAAWDAKGEKNEQLVGDQHKLDIDDDGKIDADDLKAVRAGAKKEESIILSDPKKIQEIATGKLNKIKSELDKLKSEKVSVKDATDVISALVKQNSSGMNRLKVSKLEDTFMEYFSGSQDWKWTVKKINMISSPLFGSAYDESINEEEDPDKVWVVTKNKGQAYQISKKAYNANKDRYILGGNRAQANQYAKKIRDKKKPTTESVNEGVKRFYQQDNIGKAKYTISYHDGVQKHKDGSDFYGINIFKSKPELENFRQELLKKGYREDSGFKKESVNENKTYSTKFASWFTGTSLNRVKHPVYGKHKVTPEQIKYSPGEYKSKLWKEIEKYVKSGDITPNHIKQNESVNEQKLSKSHLPSWIFDDPYDFEEWYEKGMKLKKGKISPFSSADEKKLFSLVGEWQDSNDDNAYSGEDGDGRIQKEIEKFLLSKSVVVNESVNEQKLSKSHLPSWIFDDPYDFEEWYEKGMKLKKGKISPFSSADEKKLFSLVGEWQDSNDDNAYSGEDGDGRIQKEIEKFLLSKSVVVNESVNENFSPSDIEKIKSAVKDSASFMQIGRGLQKSGFKYGFMTSPYPMYMIKKGSKQYILINKKYADEPEFVIGDTAGGLLEGRSVNEGRNVGDTLKHKHIDGLTVTLVSPTDKGWKVKQRETHQSWGDAKLKTPKEKTAFFSTADLNSLFEGALNEESGHVIKIDKPADIKSPKVKSQIEDLAKKGVRSKEIRLQMGFVTSSPKSVEDEFQKIKNHVYFNMANESKNPSKIFEGRAFINAARKAKQEGKTEFEFNGKKYPVTIKETKINESLDSDIKAVIAHIKDGEGWISSDYVEDTWDNISSIPFKKVSKDVISALKKAGLVK